MVSVIVSADVLRTGYSVKKGRKRSKGTIGTEKWPFVRTTDI